MCEKKQSKQDQRTAQTKEKLERVAREFFGTRGFASVGAEEIVAQAGVTRGALYHHYGGKQGLFEAVIESMMREIHQKLGQAASSQKDPISMLKRGILAFLEICREPEIQRLLFGDAPNVLGWARWRELDEKYALGMLMQVLKAAQATGQMRVGSPRVTAHLLVNALIEAARLIQHAEGDEETQREVEDTLFAFVDGLGGKGI